MQHPGDAVLLVRVLGGIEVRASAERAWTSPPPQQRIVLALLVAQLGSPCRSDQLVQALWSDSAPANARRLLQALVSRLRQALDPGDPGAGLRLSTVPDGWQLDVDPDAVDVGRFERLVATAEEAAGRGALTTARRGLEEALGLWRGRPFAELADHPSLVGETMRLDEEWLAARERLLELRVDAGEHGEVVAELREFVAGHPLRERLWGLLMRALCRSGRRADALAAYQTLRDRLAAELGTEPGPQLQELHATILRSDQPGAGPAAGARPEKTRRRSPAAPSWPCRRDLPLTGRGPELAALRAAVGRLTGGGSELVLVGGEPGIGKTRLVAEFADAARDEGVEVLVGRCLDGAAAPYQPFVEALRADAQITPDEELAERLGEHAGELARLIPELADRTGRAPPPSSVSPELDQHRLFGAVAEWLAAASSQTPLLVVIEDLHAATRPTLLLLRHIVEATPGGHPLLVVTLRDTADAGSGELSETVAALDRRPDVTHLRLGGLDPPAIAELLAARHGDLPDRAEWADAVYGATAGNPLFVEEVLAALDDSRPAKAEMLVDHVAARKGIRQLLESRLRRLSPTTAELLQQAAVAGDSFDFAEVTQAAGLSENEALDALEEATKARLVSGAAAEQDRHRFAHALMRGALLDSVTPSRRIRLHARMAATLEARHARDPSPVVDRLARHYAAAGPAGDRTKALTYTAAAADRAMDQRAHDDAAAKYEHALELLGDRGDAERRCDLLVRLGEAQDRAGLPARRSSLLAATRLAIDLGDPDRIARAAVADSRGFFSGLGGVDEDRVALLEESLGVVSGDHPGPRALLLAVLASERVFDTDLSHRRGLTDEALRLAREQGDPSVLGRVLALRGMTIQHPETLDERLAETAELVDLARRLDDPAVEAFAHTWRFVAALEACDRPGADAAADEAIRLADAFGHPVVQTFVLSTDSARELLWGSLDRAERIAEQYHTLGLRSGVSDVDSPYLAQQFLLHRERGRLGDYLALLDRALDAYGAVPAWQAAAAVVWWLTGDRDRALSVLDRYSVDDFASVPRDHLWTDTLCLLAEVAALACNRQAAEALLRLLAPYHDRLAVEPSVPLGAVAHYLGLLAATVEDWDRADRYLGRAERVHEQLGADRWHARTLHARVRLCLSRDGRGDRAEASRLLRMATTRAEQHGQAGLLREADLLPATTGAARTP